MQVMSLLRYSKGVLKMWRLKFRSSGRERLWEPNWKIENKHFVSQQTFLFSLICMLLINTVHGVWTESLMDLCRIHQIYFAWENTRNVVSKAKMFHFGPFTMKSLTFCCETILVENKSLLMLNKGTSFQQYREISSQTEYLIKSRTLRSFFFLNYYFERSTDKISSTL